MKTELHHSTRRMKLGDTFTVHTPRRDFKFKIIGLYSDSSKRGESFTYQVARVLN